VLRRQGTRLGLSNQFMLRLLSKASQFGGGSIGGHAQSGVAASLEVSFHRQPHAVENILQRRRIFRAQQDSSAAVMRSIRDARIYQELMAGDAQNVKITEQLPGDAARQPAGAARFKVISIIQANIYNHVLCSCLTIFRNTL